MQDQGTEQPTKTYGGRSRTMVQYGSLTHHAVTRMQPERIDLVHLSGLKFNVLHGFNY